VWRGSPKTEQKRRKHLSNKEKENTEKYIGHRVNENGLWRIRSNQELMELRLLGHVEIMPEGRTVKNVFANIPEGKLQVGKPSNRWLADD
jgi:hypothetical protein